jgi:hypothetical protein
MGLEFFERWQVVDLSRGPIERARKGHSRTLAQAGMLAPECSIMKHSDVLLVHETK